MFRPPQFTAARHRKFRPRPWSILLTLFGCATFVALGFWQIQRGEQRAHLDAQLAAARNARPVDLTADAQRRPPALGVMAARTQGHYLPERQLLLGEQSHGDAVGYDVLTPLQLPDGDLLLVNRGWLPGTPDPHYRPKVNVPADTRDVVGLWRRLPAPGLRLNADNCRSAPWPRIVSFPDAADLRCLYGRPVRAGELLLDARQPDGYTRDWHFGDPFPPSRHYAYAVQWFAFGLVALFLFFRLNLKPRP